VADQFNVDARTLGREFRKAGIAIRPRQGWTRTPPICAPSPVYQAFWDTSRRCPKVRVGAARDWPGHVIGRKERVLS
jgi:hypothetical protein